MADVVKVAARMELIGVLWEEIQGEMSLRPPGEEWLRIADTVAGRAAAMRRGLANPLEVALQLNFDINSGHAVRIWMGWHVFYDW